MSTSRCQSHRPVCSRTRRRGDDVHGLDAGCNNIEVIRFCSIKGGDPIDPADTALVRPYARTALGWTSTGATVIVTVDGRDASRGHGISIDGVARVASRDHRIALDGATRHPSTPEARR